MLCPAVTGADSYEKRSRRSGRRPRPARRRPSLADPARAAARPLCRAARADGNAASALKPYPLTATPVVTFEILERNRCFAQGWRAQAAIESVVFLVASQAGMCSRRRTYFLLLRQKKVGKEKATPLAVSLRFAAGSLRCSGMGRRCGTRCALAALRSDSRSESEHEAWSCCAAHVRPTPCASRHGQRGLGNTGHRFARPEATTGRTANNWHPPKAAEQAMPATAVAGLVPATGGVPPPEERGGKARQRLRGVFPTPHSPAQRSARRRAGSAVPRICRPWRRCCGPGRCPSRAGR